MSIAESLAISGTVNTTTQPQSYSSEAVILPNGKHGLGVWSGRRKVTSIRIDETLYSAFKPVAVAKFGSVCRTVEAMMAGVLGAMDSLEEMDAYRPTTVEVKKMVIERNVRSRRKLDPLPDSEGMAFEDRVDELEAGLLDYCGRLGKREVEYSHVKGRFSHYPKEVWIQVHNRFKEMGLKLWMG